MTREGYVEYLETLAEQVRVLAQHNADLRASLNALEARAEAAERKAARYRLALELVAVGHAVVESAGGHIVTMTPETWDKVRMALADDRLSSPTGARNEGNDE